MLYKTEVCFGTNFSLTRDFSSDLHVANMWVGGGSSRRKCFTNVNQMPRLHPVMKTVLGDNILVYYMGCILDKHYNNHDINAHLRTTDNTDNLTFLT